MSDDRLEDENARKKQRLDEDESLERKKRNVTPNAGLDTSIIIDNKVDEKEIIAAYYERFGRQPGYKQPVVNKDGSISMSFPNKGDAESFFADEARKGRKMVIIDAETGTVMAYSNGLDPTLYHADGRAFEPGDELQPSAIKKEDFSIPELPRMRR